MEIILKIEEKLFFIKKRLINEMFLLVLVNYLKCRNSMDRLVGG